MPNGAKARAALAALACMIVLAACAPLHQGLGPATTTPQLRADHAVMPDGTVLPLRIWLPEGGAPRAVILALHGFNDYGNAFAEPARSLARHGLATIAYDQRGFGAASRPGIWPGTEALISDLRAMITLVRARYPDVPLIALGESMGGAVLLAAAGEAPLGADRTVLIAPAVRGRAALNPAYRTALWLGAHLFPWAEVTGRGLKIVASDNVEMIRGLQRDPLVIKSTRIDSVWGLVNLMDAALAAAAEIEPPVLIVYGANDQVVPKEPTADLLRRVPPRARIAVYEAGYHMLLRDLGADVPLNDIARWATDPGAPLASGAEEMAALFFGSDLAGRGATREDATTARADGGGLGRSEQP